MSKVADYFRAPFANYDIVVYFGGGLFSLPFIYRFFFEPFDLKFPSFVVPLATPLLTEIVFLLSSAFSIYIVGHFLAYIGSQLIEKVIDRALGKVSSAIIVAANSTSASRNEHIRALIFDRVRAIKPDRSVWTFSIRLLFHLIFLPVYAVIFFGGFFGYYNTRVTAGILKQAGSLARSRDMEVGPISLHNAWFKPIEYWAINNNPASVPRMYNYLVIGGLFRTLALIFLVCSWAQFYNPIHFLIDGDWHLNGLMGMTKFAGILEFCAYVAAFFFSLFSYVKFQRRYAEEAIFAFVYAPRN